MTLPVPAPARLASPPTPPPRAHAVAPRVDRYLTRGRTWVGCGMRVWLVVAVVLGALFSAEPASALDEVVLKNGRRYLGTIISSTPTAIVLAIDGGTVEFPRSIVVSPPHFALESEPDTTGTAPAGAGPATATDVVEVPSSHPLPDVGEALQRLGRFPWAQGIRQVPVLVTDQGRWQFLPSISFWAADFFQLSFFGDPARPSAVELSLHHPPATAWEQKRKLLEYVLSLAPGLAVDNRFDQLKLDGDQFTFGDLWLEVSGPDSAKSPGRWVVLLLHETSLNAARASYHDIEAISELLPAATIDPNKPRSWQRGTWLPDELTWVREAPGSVTVEAVEPGGASRNLAFTALGGERVFVRAFVRDRGNYLRANTDWTRAFVTNAP